MKNKTKVAVIFGGKSSEHEISFLSGRNVIQSLDKDEYEVLPVFISKSGKWQLTNVESLLKIKDPIKLKNTTKEISLYKKNDIKNLEQSIGKRVDVVFIALHGPYGEDGSIQGMFESLGIKYTGSGVLASALGMNKVIFRKLMEQEMIPVPKYLELKKGDNFKKIKKVLKRPPYFVKPYDQGSSVGASIVKKDKDLGKSIKLAHTFSEIALVDKYIKGKEVTCGVIGGNKPIALPLVEIVPNSDFFDYTSKYSESGAQEIVPARVRKSLVKKVQEIALQVYKTVGCKGFARVDFILEDDIRPVVLEINTIPGLTEMSLLPKAAKAAGIEYPNLIDRIIKYAIKED